MYSTQPVPAFASASDQLFFTMSDTPALGLQHRQTHPTADRLPNDIYLDILKSVDDVQSLVKCKEASFTQ